jgi:tetratricopeptide (TPR) repeat protein
MRARPGMRSVTLAALLLLLAAAAPDPDRAAALDRLYTRLQNATSEQEAGTIEGAIERTWSANGSAAVQLLMGRATRELEAGSTSDAIDDFSGVIALDPTLTEAWRRRALARAQAGDTRGAIADIRQTLVHDPHQFAALRSLEQIAEHTEDWHGAYLAWTRLMAIDPKTPGGAAKLADLKRRALGEEM